MWRIQRQFIIFMIPMVIIGFILFSFYQKYKGVPTCFDNKKNGQEDGVDCGGRCVSCRFFETQSIQVVWSVVMPIREGSYDVIANIKNPNLQHGSSQVDYEIKLNDAEGVSIGTWNGSTFIAPNEDVVIVETDIRTSFIPKTAEFKIKRVVWIRDINPPPSQSIGFTKRTHSVQENTEGIRQSIVETAIFNNTLENFSSVFVTMLLYDKNKNIIGAHKTIVENLNVGETRPLQFVWPEEIHSSIEDIEGSARVNTFLK